MGILFGDYVWKYTRSESKGWFTIPMRKQSTRSSSCFHCVVALGCRYTYRFISRKFKIRINPISQHHDGQADFFGAHFVIRSRYHGEAFDTFVFDQPHCKHHLQNFLINYSLTKASRCCSSMPCFVSWILVLACSPFQNTIIAVPLTNDNAWRNHAR